MEPEATEPPARRPLYRPLGHFRCCGNVATSIVLAVVLIVFIYQPVKVEGTSMMPGLTDQERIFINKYTYQAGRGFDRALRIWWCSITRTIPASRTSSASSACRATTVEIKDGEVYVNGQKLDEPYVPDEYRDHVHARQEVVRAAGQILRAGRSPEFVQ